MVDENVLELVFIVVQTFEYIKNCIILNGELKVNLKYVYNTPCGSHQLHYVASLNIQSFHFT